jgi:dimethylhistidine N-methyltransferase
MTQTLVYLHECAPAHQDLLAEVVDGLSQTPKTLPCKLLYDKRGSEIFDLICEVEEYYPTRTEQVILTQYIGEMAAAVGSQALVLEYGSGSSVKIRMLLDALEDPAGYVPIEISKEHLIEAAQALAGDYPGLPIWPVWADYTAPFSLPPDLDAHTNRLVFFPGSTIGNFHPADAQAFLARIARVAGPGGRLLIGVDLKKDRAVLEQAYDDSEGVTAAFNLNVLEHINRELDANFPIEVFRHRAIYNEEAGRIEMHLVCTEGKAVEVGGAGVRFEPGESIRTECSYKYSVEGFTELAQKAGFGVENVWTDPERLFSIQLLRVRR